MPKRRIETAAFRIALDAARKQPKTYHETIIRVSFGSHLFAV